MTRFHCPGCGIIPYSEVHSVGAHARDSRLECLNCGQAVRVVDAWARCDGCGADYLVEEGCGSVGCPDPAPGL